VSERRVVAVTFALLVLAAAAVGLHGARSGPQGRGRTAPVTGSAEPVHETSTTAPTTPTSSSATCPWLVGKILEGGRLCAQAEVVVRTCHPDPGSLRLSSRQKDTATWNLRRESAPAKAETLSVQGQGVSVLSCGNATNGIDVTEMLAAVRDVAASGWGISVGSVSCGSRDGRPVDELPTGESMIWCSVFDSEGNGSPAAVSVTAVPPYFAVLLGE
jgi:hypothetical protein